MQTSENPNSGLIPAGMATPHYKELLQQCVHCGLCLESCPTYFLFGTEMDSPRGRIELMKAASEGRIDRESFRTVFYEHITLCLECRACETACPSGVQYGKLVEEARIAVEQEKPPAGVEGALKRIGLERLMPDLSTFKRFAGLFRLYQRTGLERLVRKINLLPWRLQGMADLLPPISSSGLQAGGVYPAQGQKRGTVAFFTGCVQEAFLGRINAATVRVLQRNGFEVHVPATQTCCGAAQWHTGDHTLAVSLARKNIDAFLDEPFDAVINNAGGCGLTLQEYPDLLREDPDYAEKARRFAEKVIDFSQFLQQNSIEPPTGRLAVRAVYSDSCHLRHGQKVVTEPRALLQSIPGLELVEMKNPDRCCGSAGIYNMLIPEPANALLEAKMADIAATQARLVVSSNTGCHMQLVMGARRSGRDLHVMHIAEVLDYAYRAESRWLQTPVKAPRPLKNPRPAPQRWLAWLDQRKKRRTQSRRFSDLRAQLEAGQLLEDPIEIITYERDAANDRGAADAVVFPYNTNDVQATIRWCSQTHTPVIARGAGSGLAGNAVAEHGGVILEFSQMKAVKRLDAVQRTVTVEPGVITQALDDLVRPLGLTYPPDPASGKVSTLGGNISLNSGGPHCFKYGVTSNYVLGLEMVLANGERLSLGGEALDLPGYDLVGLLTGSEGMLGVVTEATLALKPRPPAVKTMMAAFDSLEQAGDAVSAIIARGLMPATLELMDQRMMRAVEDFVGAGLPADSAAALILETDGYAQSVGPQMDEIITVLQECGVQKMQIAADEAQRERIWYARKSSAGAVARMAPGEYTVDATVPRSKMAQAIREINRILKQAELEACILGHAGDGNLHPMILIHDPQDAALMARIERAGAAISQYCVEIGGSITGEHGVGIEKRAFMPFMFNRDELAAMQEIKDLFDPQNLLNPGKVFPPLEHEASEEETWEEIGSLEPRTATEAAHAIQQARANKQALHIQPGKPHHEGGNGNQPEAGGIAKVKILSSANLVGMHEYRPEDLYFTAGAGMKLEDARTTLAADQMMLPLVSPWPGCTLGGLAASNFNAPLRMRYGGLRDLVLAMTVVLPDGRTLRLGRPVVKNVAGYDLVKLFIGSYGSLGLITDLTLKIFPQPRQRLSRIATVKDLQSGLSLGKKLGGLLTASAVLLAKGTVSEMTAPYSLIYTLEGYPEDVQAEDEIVRAELEKAGVHWRTIEQTGSQVWADWLGSVQPTENSYRIGIPPGQLPNLLDQLESLQEGQWMVDVSSSLLFSRGSKLSDAVRNEILKRNGYAVLLQPAGLETGGNERWLHQADTLELMSRIKKHWDPDGLFNPGAFIV